ncbi:hypothetical protein HAX54_037402 [Datura stramonium]|uniref:Uncharacterized protein n=1 Tax=Datura stramonium TaxID=4076 RepID=A0ABS8SHX5_DATST|nr:hypothetical protein [Datura stramonium]
MHEAVSRISVLASEQRRIQDLEWWSSETIAVVTGGNRGIGFEIVHQLALHGVTVVLTSRETAVGEEAAKFANVMYGLVNNAGVNFNIGKDNSVEFAEMVIQVNYFGTKNMIKALVPLMRPSPAGARIVSVTSRLGRLNSKQNGISNVTVRKQLEDVESLSEEVIDNTVNTFLEQVKEGTWESGGWPQVFTDYSLSKLAVNAYTRLMARIFEERPEGHKIYINCYCPGWVKTAMTGWAGHVLLKMQLDTACSLACLLPDRL